MKNRSNKAYTGLILILAFIFSSCNDESFFELERPPQFPWDNVSELEFAAVAPYSNYFHDTWQGPHGNNLCFQVMESDYFRWIGNVESYGTEQIYYRRFDERVPDIEYPFAKFYKTIGICNTGLDFFKETEDKPFETTTDDQKKNVLRIKGELLFMRAYTYYILTSIYCPPYDPSTANEAVLPLRDHVATGSDDALDNNPVPTQQIFDLMVADLKEAKELLPEDYENGMHASYQSRGRATKYAAAALLARVYFTMRNFTGTESALSELDFVINSNKFSLEPDPLTNFVNQESYPNNSEVIWWAFFADPIKSPSQHMCARLGHFTKGTYRMINGGRGTKADWNQLAWTQMILSKQTLKAMDWMADPVNGDYTETDAARADKRYQELFWRYEGAWADAPSPQNLRKNVSDDGKYLKISKFYSLIGQDEAFLVLDKWYKSPLGRLQNMPQIRLAELYLNRAIIKKRANQAGWAADFNKVAARAWDETVAGSAYVNKTDSEVTEDMIHVERWKEMAGEDEWYIQYLCALKMPLAQGARTSGSALQYPYSGMGWENCIPLGETDYRN